MELDYEIVSLSRVNSVAPYQVSYLSNKSEVLYFSTSKGLEYAVTFVLDKTLGFIDMYQLVIEEIHQSRAKYDISVEKTLIAIIEDFLMKDSHILAFVCDTSDSREAARHSLFNRWFLKYNKNSFYHKMDGIINAEGNMYYSSLIFNRNHPQCETIKSVYIDFIGELQK
ncbi:MAG: hypothetical protein II999_06750 [Bacteroidaceae bacterium]|nr:hypothetical protein [Bacteroidaceae bacterium]